MQEMEEANLERERLSSSGSARSSRARRIRPRVSTQSKHSRLHHLQQELANPTLSLLLPVPPSLHSSHRQYTSPGAKQHLRPSRNPSLIISPTPPLSSSSSPSLPAFISQLPPASTTTMLTSVLVKWLPQAIADCFRWGPTENRLYVQDLSHIMSVLHRIKGRLSRTGRLWLIHQGVSVMDRLVHVLRESSLISFETLPSQLFSVQKPSTPSRKCSITSSPSSPSSCRPS